jgi:hypothetical protein
MKSTAQKEKEKQRCAEMERAGFTGVREWKAFGLVIQQQLLAVIRNDPQATELKSVPRVVEADSLILSLRASLGDCEIGDANAVVLAEYLKQATQLKEL